MKRALKMHITGSVQGIFFRQFIKDSADSNNIKGFVRNLEDGRVEVFMEGNSDDVESMAAICRRGPRHSTIRNVEEKDERFQGLKEFKILRM